MSVLNWMWLDELVVYFCFFDCCWNWFGCLEYVDGVYYLDFFYYFYCYVVEFIGGDCVFCFYFMV